MKKAALFLLLIGLALATANAQTYTATTIPLDGVLTDSYVAVDGSGNLYVSTAGAQSSAVVEKATLGTGGSYTVSNIWSQANTTANEVAVDSSGNAYVAAYDSSGGDQDFGLLTPYSPSGLATVVDINNPNTSLNNLNAAVTPNGGLVFFSTGYAPSEIFEWGRLKNFQGGYDDGFREANVIPVDTGFLINSIAADAEDNVYVASGPGLFKETFNGSSYTESTIPTSGLGTFLTAIAVDSNGNVYVSDYLNSRLVLFAAGTYTQTIIATGYQINSLAVDSENNIYCVLTNEANSLLKLSPSRPRTL